MTEMVYKHDTRFKVVKHTEKVFNGVGKKDAFKDFFDLYVDGKLHSKHFNLGSVNQVIFQLTDGKYGYITGEDYE